MSNQFLKLRRSAVQGRIPTTSSLDFGEIALNTYDGLAFIKKSGSNGEEIIAIGSTQGAFTGSFSGSFTGSLQGTASWAYNAITASYALNATSNISGPDYIVPIYSGSNALTSSRIYQSASFTAINYSGIPEDPTNPDMLYVSGDGVDTYNLITAHGNKTGYVQINVQNYSNSDQASSDIVATADNGTESENYIDMGINSSGFTNTGNVGGQNDAYVYSTGNDLYIGNASAGKQVIIFNGGLDAAAQAKVWIHDQGTVSINTDSYNTSNPPSLQVNAPNANTYNIAQFFGNTNNFAQVGIANANGGTTASTDLALYNNIDYENQLAGFVDLGINSTNYVYNGIYPGAAGDAYLFTDSEHLLLGATSASGNTKVTLFAGGISEFENAKLVLYGSNQHQMSGSLDISGSLTVRNGITGSLYGTASWALNAFTASFIALGATASYSLTASYLLGTVASASYADFAVSSSYPIAVTGSTLYSFNAGVPSGYSTQNSIFLGTRAGYLVDGALSSVFIGIDAGNGAKNAGQSNFIGDGAGFSASNADNSIFIGNSAGYIAKNANNSNFIGLGAGGNAINANNSNFIGWFAGEYATNAYKSNFFGYSAGGAAASASNANFIGNEAGLSATNANGANFIGDNAGYGATNAAYSNFIGGFAGYTANNSQYSNFIGEGAGNNATDANESNFIGFQAGAGAYYAKNSVFVGYNSGYSAQNASHSIFIGTETGYQSAQAAFSVLLGYKVARSSTIGRNNIIIGTNITLEDNRKDSINLGGLIFGTGSYSITSSIVPFSGSANGRVGINQPNPIFSLDVSGSGRYTNGLQVTSSLVAPSITGSLFGTASWATNFITGSVTSASFASTSSWANNFFTASVTSASFASTSSLALNFITSSVTSASFAQTASFGGNFTASNALINGTITAQTLVVQTITSSVEYITGSTQFGSLLINTHQFTGSVSITGSLTVNDSSIILSSQTSSMSVASASIATSASYAVNAVSSSYPIAVTGSTLYSTSPLSWIPSDLGTNNSIFLGDGAGYNAVGSEYSIFLGQYAGYSTSLTSNSNFFGYQAGYSASEAYNSNFFGGNAGYYATYAQYSNFLGTFAGESASNASYSNFIGNYAGYQATNANNSNFFGQNAGQYATNANKSIFIGYQAGLQAVNSNDAVIIGSQAGDSATAAPYSVFIGQLAGNSAQYAQSSVFLGNGAGQLAVSSSYSTFIGQDAGYNATFASYSVFLGYQAGRRGTTQPGANNIIIGTNISVPTNQANSINLGAIIFATGSYGTITGNPFTGTTNGRVGINQPNPVFSLDVSGSGRYTNGLHVTSSLVAPSITGSLFGTASWALNALTASYVANASSFPFTGSAIITGSLTVTGSTNVQRLNIGSSQFNNTSSLTVAGTTVVSLLPTSSYTSCFYNYTIASESNARSGQVMSVWNGASVKYTEVTTTDIGNTATASFSVSLSGANVQLNFTAPGVWTVKSIANLL